MTEPEKIADEGQVLALLRELSQQLLVWSWEGVAGYEEIVERVGRSYGYPETAVNMDAQSAMIKLAPDSTVTFVKCGIPGFPVLAETQEVRNMLEDIYAGKITVEQAREALKNLKEKEPPYGPFLVWLGVIIISVGFAIDIVGTWEGMLWAAITATATGLVFLAADHVPGFGKVAQLTATFISGVIVMLAAKFGWTVAAPGLLLIASTFVFLPGDSISTQAFELAEGKWSAGVSRLGYAIMMLVLMATGASLAAMVTGTAIENLLPSGPHDAFPWWAAYPAHVILVIGVMFAFQMSVKHLPQVLITMLFATAVLQVATLAYGEYAGVFLSMAAGTVLSMWLARKPGAIPMFVMVVPLVFMLSPGSRGLRQFDTWISGQSITGVDDLKTTAATLLAIAMGMVVGAVIGRKWNWIRRKRVEYKAS